MTLIAFHAQADRADVITDTGSYSRGNRRVASDPKIAPLPGPGGVVVTQGSGTFGRLWRDRVAALAATARDFDDLARQARADLRSTWAALDQQVQDTNRAEGTTTELANSTVFLIGYSARERRYRAYGFASDQKWTRMTLHGLYVMPSPLTVRPGPVELERLAKHFRANFDDATPVDQLRSLPTPTPPTSVEEWVQLARDVREERAMAPLYSGFKTVVSGDVVHTAVTAGGVSSRVVHTYDDGPEETARMYAGTLHPAAQAAACDCGSGSRYVDCCLAQIANEACPCGSGTTFAGCCSFTAPEPVLVH